MVDVSSVSFTRLESRGLSFTSPSGLSFSSGQRLPERLRVASLLSPDPHDSLLSPRRTSLNGSLGASPRVSSSGSPRTPTGTRFEDPMLVWRSKQPESSSLSSSLTNSTSSSAANNNATTTSWPASPVYKPSSPTTLSLRGPVENKGDQPRRSNPGVAFLTAESIIASDSRATSRIHSRQPSESGSAHRSQDLAEGGDVEVCGDNASETSSAAEDSMYAEDSLLEDFVARRHSYHHQHQHHQSSPGAPPQSQAPHIGNGTKWMSQSVRLNEEEEFFRRLSNSRSSWRQRNNSAGSDAGLQGQTHEVLQQLLSDLRKPSGSSMSKASSPEKPIYHSNSGMERVNSFSRPGSARAARSQSLHQSFD